MHFSKRKILKKINKIKKINYFYNVIFNDGKPEKICITFKIGTKIRDIIKQYFIKIQKPNLISQNIDNIYFIWNGIILNK
jgi:hypothetical protein